MILDDTLTSPFLVNLGLRGPSQPMVREYVDALVRARAALQVDPQHAVCAKPHFVSHLDGSWRAKLRRPSRDVLARMLGKTHREVPFTAFEWPASVRFSRAPAAGGCADEDGVFVLGVGEVSDEEARALGWDAWRALGEEEMAEGVRIRGTTWFRCGFRFEVHHGYDEAGWQSWRKDPGWQTPVVVNVMDSVSRAMFYRAFEKTLALLARQNGHAERASWVQASPAKHSVGAFEETVAKEACYSVFDFRMAHTVGRGTAEQIGPLWTGFHVLKPGYSTTRAKRRRSVAEFGEDGLTTTSHRCCLPKLLKYRYGHHTVTSHHSVNKLVDLCRWDDVIHKHSKAPAVEPGRWESGGRKIVGSEQVVQYQLALIADVMRGWQSGKAPSAPFVYFKGKEAHDTDSRLVHLLDDRMFKWLRTVLEPGQELTTEFEWTPDVLPPGDPNRLPIVVLMSDHGVMYGDVARETAAGYIETQNPVMVLMVPNALLQRCPAVYDALRRNQERLVTVFDLRKTLLDLPHALARDGNCNELWSEREPCAPYGQSLTRPVSEQRSCHEAGVPDAMCLCSDWKAVDDDALAARLGGVIVRHINDKVGRPYGGNQPCAPLSLKSVEWARVKRIKPIVWVGSKPKVSEGASKTYQIALTTKAALGIFEEKFEGTVVVGSGGDTEVTFVLHTSRFSIYDYCRPAAHPHRHLCVCKLPWLEGVPGEDASHQPPEGYEVPE